MGSGVGGEVGWLERERTWLWMASQGQEVEGPSGHIQGSRGPLSVMEASGQSRAGQEQGFSCSMEAGLRDKGSHHD